MLALINCNKLNTSLFTLTDSVITQNTLKAERPQHILVARLKDNEGCGLVNMILIWE